MKTFLKCLLVMVVAAVVLALWREYRKPGVAAYRLAALRIVKAGCQPEHLYSSGILRENTHVFRMKRGCLAGDAANPEEQMKPHLIGDPYEQFMLGRYQRFLKRVLPGAKLDELRYFSAFDDRAFTSFGVVIEKDNETVYVIVEPF